MDINSNSGGLRSVHGREMKFVSLFLVIFFGILIKLVISNEAQRGNIIAVLKSQLIGPLGYSFLIDAYEETDLVSMLESRKFEYF